jgi:hypothetical protein
MQFLLLVELIFINSPIVYVDGLLSSECEKFSSRG